MVEKARKKEVILFIVWAISGCIEHPVAWVISVAALIGIFLGGSYD